MTIQIRKTYRGANPEMVRDELQGLVQKQGVTIDDAKMQIYSLPSGSTQCRVTLVFKTQGERPEAQKECGGAHIIGESTGETRLLINLDETLFPQEKISALQENLDFILGSYELKW